MQVLYFWHMQYKAIGFDHGGVIEGRPGFQFNQMICHTLDTTQADYESAYFAHNRDSINGELISEIELWTRVLKDLHREDLLQTLTGNIAEYKRTNNFINEELLAHIASFRSKGFKTGLLSNNSIEVANRLRDVGQDAYFDSFIISAEVGMSKPDPKIFDYFCNDLGVQMNELIFVDDSPQSLSTAEECGFTPILYTNFDDLVRQLGSLGIDIS